jgi:hypothetical protein
MTVVSAANGAAVAASIRNSAATQPEKSSYST